LLFSKERMILEGEGDVVLGGARNRYGHHIKQRKALFQTTEYVFKCCLRFNKYSFVLPRTGGCGVPICCQRVDGKRIFIKCSLGTLGTRKPETSE